MSLQLEDITAELAGSCRPSRYSLVDLLNVIRASELLARLALTVAREAPGWASAAWKVASPPESAARPSTSW